MREDGKVDRAEAQVVAEQVLAHLIERQNHRDLVSLVDRPMWVDRTAPSGTTYAVQLCGLWDGDGVLRVRAAAMDGSKRLGLVDNVVADELIDPPAWTPVDGRRVSSHFIQACVGWLVPLGFLGIGLLWMGANGYPGLGALGVAFVVAAVRVGYGAIKGGVRYPGHDVESRGIFRSQRLDRSEIRAVHIRRNRHGQPDGWFDTTGAPVRIRGITFSHADSIFDRGLCRVCADLEVTLQQVAVDLDVDLVADPVD